MRAARHLRRTGQIYRSEGVAGLTSAARRLTRRTLARARGARVGQPPTAADSPGLGPCHAVPEWLAHRDSFTLVQIGAYVGDTDNDPLFPFLTRELAYPSASIAIVVEPVRAYFEQLEVAYRDAPGVR